MRNCALHRIGALPLCVNSAGKIETFLVTTRGSRRWIIPKGKTIRGLEPHDVAAKEAFEEAGLIGKADRRSIGNFEFSWGCEARKGSCCVDVYALWIERQLKTWREMEERTVLRCTVDTALSLICTPSLGELVRRYVAAIEDRVSSRRGRTGNSAKRLIRL